MFKKYNSIENAYREEVLEQIKKEGFGEVEYIVQEKVHGANLSYWTTNGVTFHAAKRTEALEPDEKFYNYQQTLEEIQPRLANIWTTLTKKYPDIEQITIFGELMGGDYPHPDVAPNHKAKLIQKGIYYSPNNHFFAFDILINTETYLNMDEANTCFAAEGVLHAKTLFKGKLNDCLAYPNSFDSTIPAELGLPPLSPNIVEGVVIKPLNSAFLNGGSRVILKNKNEQWAENKKYHKTIRQSEELSEKVIKLQEAIATYITENRLNNVISKIGEITPADFGQLLGRLNKDVIEDFMKDYGHILEHLEKKEQKQVTKSIGKKTAELVKKKVASL